MASVQDIITQSLRHLGVYGSTEPPEAEDLADGLIIFNQLLDSWNAQHLLVYTMVNRVLPLTPMVSTYTIGPGGSFEYPRPVKIESAGVIRSSGVRHDMTIDTSVTWATIPEKLIAGKLPLRLFCDYAYPLATLRVWPGPIQPVSLDLYVWSSFNVPMVIGDIFNLPPAYGRAFFFNLTVAMAPHYGKDPGPIITGLAQQGKAEIAALNLSTFAGTQDPPQTAPPAAA